MRINFKVSWPQQVKNQFSNLTEISLKVSPNHRSKWNINSFSDTIDTSSKQQFVKTAVFQRNTTV